MRQPFKMQKSHKVGDIVRLGEAGLDNECYSQFHQSRLKITSVATKYMSAKEFFDKGKPEGYHPGFDDCGAALYDLETPEGKPIGFSLYDWEIMKDKAIETEKK